MVIKSSLPNGNMWKVGRIKKNVVWLSMMKGNQYKKVTFSHDLMEKLNVEKQKLHKNIMKYSVYSIIFI